MSEKQGAGLTLSGGGVRAAAFHAGVLKWLAERNELEEIVYISSVSGGSLFTGLVFHFNDYKWPSSGEYLEKVLPAISRLLTGRSLQMWTFLNLIFKPKNWRFLLSRANVISDTIESLWGVRAVVGDLPESPVWAVNGTTGENGKRFRIKGIDAGDYEAGYADVPDFKVADSMALSAAFPVGIGPLAFKTGSYKWRKRVRWDSPEMIENYKIPFRKLHLYDGGVYDNLGFEPIFDVGDQSIKNKKHVKLDKILVSDASCALERCRIPGPLNLLRIKRLTDIMLDQIRSLRVRAFVNFLKTNPGKGAYYQLGSDPVQVITKHGNASNPEIRELLDSNWLDMDKRKIAAEYPTTLRKMGQVDLEILVQHGYETAKWNDRLWEINITEGHDM
ncbi:MAG: patatin-like phospholipase family protein [Bacteroidales bacterium]|nr:patatin-like phospholipase family protein [Candidatus Latescibacterota bacterium]